MVYQQHVFNVEVGARIFDLVNSGVIISSGKTNGDEYPADSIYNLCCGLQRDLRLKDRTDVNIFSGAGFNRLRQILDSRMKNLKATGNHTRKRAEVIGEPIENQLWELKVLGDHDGQDSFGHIVPLCWIVLCFKRWRRTPSVTTYAITT